MGEGVWNTWHERWAEMLPACERLGGRVGPLVIEPPASEDSILSVEDELGFQLPPSVRLVLKRFSREVEMSWNLPQGVAPPNTRDPSWGGCRFSLQHVARAETVRRRWVEKCFRDPKDAYDVVWHDKIGLLAVQNGDVIAADTSQDPSPIVYLSHDSGEGHGLVLGWDFIDFLGRWSSVGCPGPEDWVWLPFYDKSANVLDPASPQAIEWRKWLGLSW